MQELYFVLAAVHLAAVAVTGALWAVVDLVPRTGLRAHLRDIRAVHFGSLYLAPILLGMAYAFQRLRVPAIHQLVFPAGLGLLLFFASAGYVFPKPPDLDPFYYWTRGWPMVLAVIGMAALGVALCWTATVLVLYARPAG
jgi:hypothetical protein